jgi:hypothetical protein
VTTDDQVRDQLRLVVQILAPYARSAGSFTNWNDLRVAIKLAVHKLERAEDIVDRKIRSTR